MLISWMLGYPDRSLDKLRAAVGSAETLGHRQTPERRDADENCSCGTGKASMGKSMTSEGLPAQYKEVADQPRDDGDDSRRREGILHEVVFKPAEQGCRTPSPG
jgi:hypothetical protein